MDYHGFYTGTVFNVYEYLGAHPSGDGITFRTFAPNAQHVAPIGDCTGWRTGSTSRSGGPCGMLLA